MHRLRLQQPGSPQLHQAELRYKSRVRQILRNLQLERHTEMLLQLLSDPHGVFKP